jgi:hypothetical protein
MPSLAVELLTKKQSTLISAGCRRPPVDSLSTKLVALSLYKIASSVVDEVVT